MSLPQRMRFLGALPIQWRDGADNEEGCPDVLYELGAQ